MDKLFEPVRSVIRNFEPFEPKDECFENIVTGIIDPPAYIVRVLLSVTDFKVYRSNSEKVDWESYLRYKNQIFMIRDYKFGSWSIESTNKTSSTMQLAKEIKTKISRAVKLLDPLFGKALKCEIRRGNFYLNNPYIKLFYIFNFFKERLSESIADYEAAEREAKDAEPLSKSPLAGLANDGNKFADFINKKIGYQFSKPPIITNYTYALSSSFFSLLEFLLCAIYSFENPSTKFMRFKNETRWDEKFRLIFDLNKSSDLKTFYDNFLKIKEEYRNPLSHGLLEDDVSLLVSFPTLGLIPVSYKHFEKIHFLGVEIQKDEAKWIIENFMNFLLFLEKNTPYSFYINYLSSGFDIPMIKKDMEKIKSNMKTPEMFEEYLKGESLRYNAILNREY